MSEVKIDKDLDLNPQLAKVVLERLISHLRHRSDVQNIDIMNLAGFCRNCLSKWYREASIDSGIPMDDPSARALIYGMPYDEWKQKFQK